ncbi:hypothetical protein V6N12_029162 [Hibiscus sabdariffa]|uniref:Secreted peptide n=1 Tax=Hibiscus sabdariffa TaxID=183260 RepID=A0ABR2CVA3_9ROSI
MPSAMKSVVVLFAWPGFLLLAFILCVTHSLAFHYLLQRKANTQVSIPPLCFFYLHIKSRFSSLGRRCIWQLRQHFFPAP